jgi:hypothetical protein
MEIDLPAVGEDHDAGGGRERLRERREIEDRVERHGRALRHQRARAIRLPQQHLVVAAHHQHAARHLSRVDGGQDRGIDSGEARVDDGVALDDGGQRSGVAVRDRRDDLANRRRRRGRALHGAPRRSRARHERQQRDDGSAHRPHDATCGART